jgi:hypothetical protein
LVLQLPTERAQDGLNETFFQTLLIAIALDSVPLHLPQFGQALQRISGFVAEFPPFRFQLQSLIQPMAGEQSDVVDRAEGKRLLG